jgi:hypothetical protein
MLSKIFTGTLMEGSEQKNTNSKEGELQTPTIITKALNKRFSMDK